MINVHAPDLMGRHGADRASVLFSLKITIVNAGDWIIILATVKGK
jgi:hypothetical protein